MNNAIKKRAVCARPACAKVWFDAEYQADIRKKRNRFLKCCATFHSTPELLGLVLENTVEVAGNLPDSEVFSRPDSFGFGRDGLVREAGRMATSMFSTSRPPVALEKAASGFESQVGAEAMTTVNTTTTPKAAHLGNTPALLPSSIARQQAIENALASALHLVRLPRTESGLQAATGRAIRAASMLKQACSEANTSGRA